MQLAMARCFCCGSCCGCGCVAMATVERGRLCCIITCNSLLAIKTFPHAPRPVRHPGRGGNSVVIAAAFTMLSYFLVSIKSKICACSQTFNFVGKLAEFLNTRNPKTIPRQDTLLDILPSRAVGQLVVSIASYRFSVFI